MVNGEKQHVPDHSVPVQARRISGVFFLVLTIAFAGYLLQNFNSDTRELNLLGSSLHLGEAEDEDEHESDDDHDHDDD